MAINAVIVIGLAAWVLRPSTADPEQIARSQAGAQPTAASLPKNVPVPTKADILAQTGVRFGLSSPQAPWSSAEINRIAKAAGKRPTMLQFFVKWTQDFRPEAVAASYTKHALPVISWEPWSGPKNGFSQPTYALSKIADGSFDPYIKKFASGIRDQKWPVAIRFAHEMNGHWYPWSEQESGNKPGDYVKAWRHVHDVFASVGANNVIWIWSPNILRPVPNVSLKALYPGDKYVDWVGMVGYEVYESTADEVYTPTMKAIRKFTKKPFVLTEVGAQPGPHQLQWISNFFAWLPKHKDVVGFVWFEFSPQQGASGDWRFTAKPAVTKVFHDGIAKVPDLTRPPAASSSGPN